MQASEQVMLVGTEWPQVENNVCHVCVSVPLPLAISLSMSVFLRLVVLSCTQALGHLDPH